MENGFDFGMTDYEIHNESYRSVLNSAILEFYKFREICYENPWKWRDRLNNRLNLIFRNRYAKLYEAKDTEFNALYNIELHETFTHTINQDGNSTVTTKTESTEKNSDNASASTKVESQNSVFPNSGSSANGLGSSIYADSGNVAKNVTESESGSNLKSTAKDESEQKDKTTMLETYSKDTVGSSAGLPFSKALIQLKEFYKKYDLDQQVIDELSDLFINIW